MTVRKPLPRNRLPAARKSHKQNFRKASGDTIPGTNVPLVVPGTNTRHEQLKQCRRWLGNERHNTPLRFPFTAIQEVEKLFNPNDATRAKHPFHAMSVEAKQTVAVLEAERAAAVSEGKQGDWWQGPSRKGISPAEAQKYRAERSMAQADAQGETELMGLEAEEDLDPDEAAAIGAFLEGALDPDGVSSNGYLDNDGESLSDFDENLVRDDSEEMDTTEG
ncbi:MAG: hypothetical protein Q9226_007443 [Calogaya cf. arnoldii]